MSINQYNAHHELTIEEQEDVIDVAKFYDSSIETIEQAIGYCMEDEEALEEVSHIADFGM